MMECSCMVNLQEYKKFQFLYIRNHTYILLKIYEDKLLFVLKRNLFKNLVQYDFLAVVHFYIGSGKSAHLISLLRG